MGGPQWEAGLQRGGHGHCPLTHTLSAHCLPSFLYYMRPAPRSKFKKYIFVTLVLLWKMNHDAYGVFNSVLWHMLSPHISSHCLFISNVFLLLRILGIGFSYSKFCLFHLHFFFFFFLPFTIILPLKTV